MMRRTVVLAFALAISAGCSSATKGSGSGAQSSSKVITQQEMASVSVQNLYEAIQRLRPDFLRARSTSAPGPGLYPEVFVDGIRKGSPEFLRTMNVREVAEVRFLSVQDATTRYGMNVPAGVLDVKLIGR
jgi:hypothetical protein